MRKATNGFKKPQTAPVKSTPEPMAFGIPEAAALLGKTNWFVEEELRKGHIPFKWVAGAKMISRRDLEAYWNSLPYAGGVSDGERQKLFEERINEVQRLTNELAAAETAGDTEGIARVKAKFEASGVEVVDEAFIRRLIRK
jgi:hypothetical protein